MPQPRSTTRSGSSGVGRRSAPRERASESAASSWRRNSSTWRSLACRLGLTRPCASVSPSARNTGSDSSSRRSLSRSCPRSACTASLRAAECSSPSPFLVTRSWWVCVVVSTCQLPNGSSKSSASSASAAGPAAGSSPKRWLLVCACVASYAVSCRCRPALRSTGRSSTRRQRGSPSRRRPEATARTSVSGARSSARRRARVRSSGSAMVSSDDGGDDDDQQQDPQRGGDDQAPVLGVHDSSLEARSSARCIAGTSARSSSWTLQDMPSASTTASGCERTVGSRCVSATATETS